MSDINHKAVMIIALATTGVGLMLTSPFLLNFTYKHFYNANGIIGSKLKLI